MLDILRQNEVGMCTVSQAGVTSEPGDGEPPYPWPLSCLDHMHFWLVLSFSSSGVKSDSYSPIAPVEKACVETMGVCQRSEEFKLLELRESSRANLT